MMRSRTKLSLLMVALSAVLLAASAAQAQNKAALDKIVQLNKAALEDFDTLEFESARKNLQQALDVAKKNKLEKHPATARTYLHLGVVQVTGFKDRAKGEEAFAAALAIQPTITIEKSLVTSELGEAFNAAKSGGSAKAARTTAPSRPASVSVSEPAAAPEEEPAKDDEPDLPAHIEALDCPFPDEAPIGKDIVLRCAAAPALSVSKVILFYRPQGKEEFLPIMMEVSRKGWWTATIQGEEVTGKSLQFYFEGRNAKDKPVASNGRADSPNVFSLREKAKKVRAGANAPAKRAERARKSELDQICEDNPVDPRCLARGEEMQEQRKLAAYKYWFGLSVGNHVGLVLGDPEVRKDLAGTFNKGISVDPWTWHISPEIGIKLSPRFALSIQSRHQYVKNPANLEGRVARGAHAVMLRAMLFLNPPATASDDSDEAPALPSATQWYLSGFIGFGEGFRLTFSPDPDLPDMKDTVRGGPVVFGPGLGFMHEWTPGFGWMAGTNLMFGAPDFNIALDVNLGVFFGAEGKKAKRTTSSEDEEPGSRKDED